MDSHFNLIYDLLPKQQPKLKKPDNIDKPIRREIVQPKVEEEEKMEEPAKNLKLPHNVNKRKAKLMRKAGDDVWVDETLE